MVGYPFNDEIYNAPFWADVANSNKNYWTDLTLSFTSNIINIAEDSRMQLAGHNVMFDDIYEIVFPSTITAGTLTVYLEINNNTKTYEIKTTDSYDGDGGDLNDIYTVKFLEVRHPGGTVNINKEAVTIFYTSTTANGIISAKDAGFSNSDYIGILNNRSKFDKIIYSEIKRLKTQYDKFISVYYEREKYGSLDNALNILDIKTTGFVLNINAEGNEHTITFISETVTSNNRTTYDPPATNTLKCNDNNLSVSLVTEGNSVDYSNMKLRQSNNILADFSGVTIQYSNFVFDINWDSDLNFIESGYRKAKMVLGFGSSPNSSSDKNFEVYVDLVTGTSLNTPLIYNSGEIDVLTGNINLTWRNNSQMLCRFDILLNSVASGIVKPMSTLWLYSVTLK